MQQFKLLGTALTAALVLAACGGGGGDGNQSPAVAYTSVVSFGDSLSDAGSYKVGTIAALGGGMFTVNGVPGSIGDATPPSYTWAQLIAAQAVGKPNCAARTGGFTVPVSTVSGCTNYAQGGARVTNPKGTNNPVGVGFIAGPTTVPVVTQIQNYLADLNNGGKFTGKEMVTVLAGANDILAQIDILKAGVISAAGKALVTSLVNQLINGLAPANQATAGPAILAAAGTAVNTAIATEAAKSTATLTSIITAATQAGTTAAGTAAAKDATDNLYTNPNLANIATTIPLTAGQAASTAASAYAADTSPTGGAGIAVQGMIDAAGELAGYVNTMVTTQGAKHVIVSNLPDVSKTPHALSTITYNVDGSIKDNSSQQLILAMTMAFNSALSTGLANTAGVLVVDVFSEHQREIKDPAHFALTNVTDTACNLATAVNPLNSSLVCNTSNLIAGDTTHYMFADDLHPTPYEHKLLAQYVAKALVIAGWL